MVVPLPRAASQASSSPDRPAPATAAAAAASNGVSAAVEVGALSNADAGHVIRSGSVAQLVTTTGGSGTSPHSQVRRTTVVPAPCSNIELARATCVGGVQVGAVRDLRPRGQHVKAVWHLWHRATHWAACTTHHVGTSRNLEVCTHAARKRWGIFCCSRRAIVRSDARGRERKQRPWCCAGLHLAAAVGLMLTLLLFPVSMVAALFLSLWLVVLLMPSLTTIADSTLPARRRFHIHMHRSIILLIPCVATIYVAVMYMHVVYYQAGTAPNATDPSADKSYTTAYMAGMHGTYSALNEDTGGGKGGDKSGDEPEKFVPDEYTAMCASFVMILTLATYRALWLLRTVPASPPQEPDTQTLLKQLQQEETLIALWKRFLIRRSFQLVLVAVVAQALLYPSVMGALFLVGTAASVRAFGETTGTQPVTASVFAAIASAAWGVLQYAACTLWLQGCLQLHVRKECSMYECTDCSESSAIECTSDQKNCHECDNRDKTVYKVLGVAALQVCAPLLVNPSR